MIRAIGRRSTLLVLLPFAVAACDAGRRVRVDARVVGESAIGDTVRAFWFDADDEGLFDEPIEDHARRVGEERRNSVSRGVTQAEWLTTRVDPTQTAHVSLLTFYAGGPPLTDLVLRKLEQSPEGLWLTVVPTGAWTPQAFLVRAVDGSPTLVRLIEAGGRWTPGNATPSTVDVQWDDSAKCYVWRFELPLEPWRSR